MMYDAPTSLTGHAVYDYEAQTRREGAEERESFLLPLNWKEVHLGND